MIFAVHKAAAYTAEEVAAACTTQRNDPSPASTYALVPL